MTSLNGKKIAFIATNGVEEPELTEPWAAVRSAGGTPVLLSGEKGRITAMKGDWEHSNAYDVDQTVDTVEAADFDALVLPGGTLNADALRLDPEVLRLVKEFDAAQKPIAAICHAPWILIEAGLVEGRTVTSYASVATDLRNAAAHWVDREVVVDANLVTSRDPGDLAAFSRELVRLTAD
ncbi:type 1 glutamine amidotransferase domain-containing protein [Kocuria sp.]|uniref:type 1 glutamine amidotransferase domain-containing protein n=1 Tax=Kocuria sp. TaxID=1871328 RepID=UPI0026E0555C|nr:type 1 glutamine amidotransferase domain-containing protein [Kocuria sp.]MDO5618667.1 type 1 glutamine amidotransferase domain-containing protein [Kocuria sp.]